MKGRKERYQLRIFGGYRESTHFLAPERLEIFTNGLRDVVPLVNRSHLHPRLALIQSELSEKSANSSFLTHHVEIEMTSPQLEKTN